MKPGPQHLKVPLKSVFHQTGRPKILGAQWRHAVINVPRKFQDKEPLVYCSELIIFSKGWPDTLIPLYCAPYSNILIM